MDVFTALNQMALQVQGQVQVTQHPRTKSKCLLFYSLLLASVKVLYADRTCMKQSTCRCQLSDNSFYYDLLPMVQGTTVPHFTLRQGNLTYYYDPCRDFNLVGTSSDCQGAAACKKGPVAQEIVNIGRMVSSEFLYVESDQQSPLRIRYHNGKSGAEQITTTVKLVCEANGISQLSLKQATQTYYLFELLSPYACMKPVPSGLSAGGLICIIFVVLVVVYFGGGFIYLFFFKYESGKKAIPHCEFWSSLPGLIRDGAVFLCGCICGGGKKMTSSAPTYDAI